MKANRLPENPTQILTPETYTSEAWLEREKRALFPETWHFGCFVNDLPKTGDYVTRKIGSNLLVLVRDKDGEIKAYHNICRHRGTEMLEGKGNTGKTIVCPYHRWTYGLNGEMRGAPDMAECFPGLNKKEHSLGSASVGEMGGIIFVNPSADPKEDFETWKADVPDHLWPHDVTSPDFFRLEHDVVYEMQCNWKVFLENAIDGYHLAYLHENTLGGPDPDKNVWDVHGRHLIWYTTERGGHKNRIPKFVEDRVGGWSNAVPHVSKPGYGGVYVLFPSTIIGASPFSFVVSSLEPIDANTTYLRSRAWVSKNSIRYSGGPEQIPGYDKKSGLVRSSHWKKHPLETGDFQTEDIWIVEKMQRALRSPAYTTTPVLAKGAGAEAPLTFFHQQILDYVKVD